MSSPPTPATEAALLHLRARRSAVHRVASPSCVNNIITYGFAINRSAWVCVCVHVLVIAIGFNLSGRRRRRRWPKMCPTTAAYAASASARDSNCGGTGTEFPRLLLRTDTYPSAAAHDSDPAQPSPARDGARPGNTPSRGPAAVRPKHGNCEPEEK